MNPHNARAELAGNGWHSASASQGQNACVELNRVPSGWTGLRDSKLGAHSPIVTLDSTQWRGFRTHLRAG